MKHLLLYVVAVFFCAQSFATTYYSQGSLSPTSLSSWNTNRTGGGTSPASFTVNGDEFIIQGNDNMVVAQNWILGAGVTLHIEANGTLLASQGVDVPGTFQIDNGGTYIHNTTDSPITNGIFGGTVSFAADATVEIRNWINNQTALPSGITWGNLVINYTRNLGVWDQDGNLSDIAGNLIIDNTGTTSSFNLTANTDQNLTIGGNLEVNNGSLVVKSGRGGTSSSFVDVNGNIVVVDGTLDLGDVHSAPDNELRFNGNLDLSGTGTITSIDPQVFLVATGTQQSLSVSGSLGCSFKIMPGSQVSVNADLNFLPGMFFVISGQCEMNAHQLTMDESLLTVAGGNLLLDGAATFTNMSCTVCSGDGTLAFGNSNWCKASGTVGAINISDATLIFSRSDLSMLNVGDMNSPGRLSLNNASISFTGDAGSFPEGFGDIELAANSTLSFDATSIIEGDAFYNGNGGNLVIGSSDGITLADQSGNIMVNGGRNYNQSGANSFEYASSENQSTGDGLPASISGTLKINNTNGVTLTGPVTIESGGSLDLADGVLVTDLSALVTIASGGSATGGSATSYVNGPLKKIGSTNFIFPIGKSGIYSPVSMASASPADEDTDDFTAEYFPANPQAVYPGGLLNNLDHLSRVEYWLVQQDPNQVQKLKRIRLTINPTSGVSDPQSLVVALYDNGFWQSRGQDAYTGDAQNGTIEFQTDYYQPLTLGALSALNALPVKLLSFNAIKQNKKGKITWEIAKDEKADHFEILRSLDKQNFSSLATVPAATGRFEYSLNDVELPSATTYYRLKITGADGSVTLSHVVALFNDNSGFAIVSANPTVISSATTNINLSSSSQDKVLLMVTNMQGQIVRNFSTNVKEGTNLIPVDCSRLSTGIYTVSAVNSKGQRSSVRIIKR